ncbi:hypothetical protein GC176_07495 [bacterium]|nr:hypothetical protein [bacterium]
MLRSGFALSFILAAVTLSGCGSETPNVDSAEPQAQTEAAANVNKPAVSGSQSARSAATSAQTEPAGSSGHADATTEVSPTSEPTVTAVTKSEPEPVAADVQPPADEKPEFPDATKLPADLLDQKKLTPLNPKGTVLLDVPNHRVFVKTNVCFTEGVLEMFLCLTQTKEHESILVFDGKAQTIHAGLLALGLKEGTPGSYDIDSGVYTPAKGEKLFIFVHWVDRDGKLHRESAQSWCRHSRFRYYEEPFATLPADLKLDPDGKLRYDEMNKVLFWYGPMSDAQRDAALKLSGDAKYQKAIRRFHDETQPKQLDADWIFVGSGFVNDPDFGERYLAEGGYVICVANFAAAMIDISTESSASGNENLTYEAWTERIPPRGSEVLVEIVPRPERPEKETGKSPAE